MRWDYRIVRRVYEDGTISHGIHRAFYKEQSADHDLPDAVSLEPCPVEGNDLPAVLREMSQALTRPLVNFSDLRNQAALADFLAAEDRRLLEGLHRKADGMDQFLSSLIEPNALEWLRDTPPEVHPGSYIAFVRKQPHADFFVEFPDLPGCATHGRSLEQASCAARTTLTAHLRALDEAGTSPPTAGSWDQVSRHPNRGNATLIVVDPLS